MNSMSKLPAPTPRWVYEAEIRKRRNDFIERASIAAMQALVSREINKIVAKDIAEDSVMLAEALANELERRK